MSALDTRWLEAVALLSEWPFIIIPVYHITVYGTTVRFQYCNTKRPLALLRSLLGA